MGGTFTSRSQAENAAQPCLYDVHTPLTVHVKGTSSKTAFSLEITVLSAERRKNSRLSQMNSPTQLLGAYIPAGKSELNCALKFISSFPDAALYPRALRSWGFQTWIEPLALALSPDFQSQSQKEKTENLTASLNLLPPGSWGSRSSAVLSLANKTRSRDEGLSNIF